MRTSQAVQLMGLCLLPVPIYGIILYFQDRAAPPPPVEGSTVVERWASTKPPLVEKVVLRKVIRRGNDFHVEWVDDDKRLRWKTLTVDNWYHTLDVLVDAEDAPWMETTTVYDECYRVAGSDEVKWTISHRKVILHIRP